MAVLSGQISFIISKKTKGKEEKEDNKKEEWEDKEENVKITNCLIWFSKA